MRFNLIASCSSLKSPGYLHDENQHLGDGAVERLGDLLVEFDLRQRLGERRVLFDWHAVLSGGLDDFPADLAAPFRGDARDARALVMERDRERSCAMLAHDARSKKRPGAARGAAGAPVRHWISPGSSS